MCGRLRRRWIHLQCNCRTCRYVVAKRIIDGHTRQARLSSVVGQNRVFLPPVSQMSTDQNEICQESVVTLSTHDDYFNPYRCTAGSRPNDNVSIHGCPRGLCIIRHGTRAFFNVQTGGGGTAP